MTRMQTEHRHMASMPSPRGDRACITGPAGSVIGAPEVHPAAVRLYATCPPCDVVTFDALEDMPPACNEHLEAAVVDVLTWRNVSSGHGAIHLGAPLRYPVESEAVICWLQKDWNGSELVQMSVLG
ncbi:hypothetical protein PsYK624_158240 [Phanerochaete sordida]|uniref:Uncharacterized protein n=1 Tax=Phanerochaete sordida TaxID=48140 RepID=A0A9P3GPW1_9APHY|nr:hypothetical protein PsYK624_158240 [Phanerochaete sordida]